MTPERAEGVVASRGPRKEDVLSLAAPAILLALLLIAGPVAYSVWLSAYDVQSDGTTRGFVGTMNLQRMLSDATFWHSLRVTAVLFVVCLACETVLGTLLALVLSVEAKGRRIVQAIVLLPSLMPPVAVGFLWLLVFEPSTGLANQLRQMGNLSPLAWLGSPENALGVVAFVDVWQWTPFFGLMLAAGIRGISDDVLDAAQLDRAGTVQRLVHVTLPLLRPALMVAITIRAVDLVRFFDTVYVMTQGGPLYATTTLNVYAYRKAFVDMEQGFSATLQLAVAAISFVGVALVWVAGSLARRSA